MGAYSTVYVTRAAAIRSLERILSDAADGNGQHDELLGNLMDVVLRKRLYNCVITHDDDPEASDDVLDYY